MPGGHRLAIITLGLVLPCGLGQAQEPGQSAEGQTQEQQVPAQALPLPFPVEIIEDEAAAEARQSSEQEARQREIDDLLAQQGMNAATQAMNEATQRMAYDSHQMTIATWIGVGLLTATLLLTLQANRAAVSAVRVTRKIGENQLRAYVDASEGNIVISDISIVPVITIRNAGQTPATELIIRFTVRYESTFDAGLSAVAAPVAARIAGIAPNSTEDVGVAGDTPENYINMHDKIIHVAGQVEYTAIDGKRYGSDFFFWTKIDLGIRKGSLTGEKFGMAPFTKGLRKFRRIEVNGCGDRKK